MSGFLVRLCRIEGAGVSQSAGDWDVGRTIEDLRFNSQKNEETFLQSV
jgi:hypothetical protein